MLAAMSRFEDTVRPLRPYRADINKDAKESGYQIPSTDHAVIRDEPPPRSSRGSSSKLLNAEGIIVLAQRAVDTGVQETKRSLAGSEDVERVVRPKLTIDLGHSNIGVVPESMVDIIKDEVAR